MKLPSVRRKVVLATTAIFLLILVLFGASAPLLIKLHNISEARSRFLLESSVDNQASLREGNKMSAEEFFNPRFLQHFNLNVDDYLDAKGYFAPNGNDWNKWNVGTRTALILLLSPGDKPPSVWGLRKIIDRVNEYYAMNDPKALLVDVINAAAAQH